MKQTNSKMKSTWIYDCFPTLKEMTQWWRWWCFACRSLYSLYSLFSLFSLTFSSPPSSYSTVFLLCQVVWAARVELFILPWRAYKTFSINIICSVIFISKNFFFFKFITHQSFRWSESWFAARERAQIVTECCRSSPSKNLDWLRWSHFMSLNWKF